MTSINKRALIERLAPTLGGIAQAGQALDAVLDVIVRAVATGDTVAVTGFGTFEPVHAAARHARNPQTNGTVIVPARIVPRFRPHQRFRDYAAGDRELPADAICIRKDPKGTYTQPADGAAA
ncbi:HU family DNA-binding protein [Kitasatospora sp. NPDC096147]|uniref:HU family DNA-binding protein n=1 Tax=Kitasatospora sp. NPDC096147 TaxID=3364093 RepID=UPI00381825ED